MLSFSAHPLCEGPPYGYRVVTKGVGLGLSHALDGRLLPANCLKTVASASRSLGHSFAELSFESPESLSEELLA